MKHLKGIYLPASKQEILQHAEHGEGPDTGAVLDVLRQIEEKEYNSVPDVMKEVGKIE